MRPRGKITGRIWDLADEVTSETESMALRRVVVERATAEGINPSTANTQYGHWKRTHFPKEEAIPASGASIPKVKDEGNSESSVLKSRHDWKRLLKNGFQYGADWLFSGDALLLDRDAPDAPGVYVFVVDDEVFYIGVTRRHLSQRMADYRRGHVKQRTSHRIHLEIIEACRRGQTVRALFAVPGLSSWNGLPIEIAAGLEAGLIAEFTPKWNKQGL